MWEKYGKFILKFENMITQHFFIPFLLIRIWKVQGLTVPICLEQSDNIWTEE
jgi:hypothetical protein